MTQDEALLIVDLARAFHLENYEYEEYIERLKDSVPEIQWDDIAYYPCIHCGSFQEKLQSRDNYCYTCWEKQPRIQGDPDQLQKISAIFKDMYVDEISSVLNAPNALTPLLKRGS